MAGAGELRQELLALARQADAVWPMTLDPTINTPDKSATVANDAIRRERWVFIRSPLLDDV